MRVKGEVEDDDHDNFATACRLKLFMISFTSANDKNDNMTKMKLTYSVSA